MRFDLGLCEDHLNIADPHLKPNPPDPNPAPQTLNIKHSNKALTETFNVKNHTLSIL